MTEKSFIMVSAQGAHRGQISCRSTQYSLTILAVAPDSLKYGTAILLSRLTEFASIQGFSHHSSWIRLSLSYLCISFRMPGGLFADSMVCALQRVKFESNFCLIPLNHATVSVMFSTKVTFFFL